MTRSLSTPLVGRVEPLRRLQEAAAVAATGRPVAVLVSGEAGMGKTTLVAAALQALRTDASGGSGSEASGGLRSRAAPLVGWGTAWHGGGAPGFWPWMQALDDLVLAVGVDAAVAAAGPDRDLLALLSRELGSAGDTGGDPDQRRLLLLDAVACWLARLADDRDVVVVLDDLQWADSSTLDLLDHVVEACPPARLLLVGAYRHDELDDRTRTRLAALGLHTDHVHLGGLDVEAVEQLLAQVRGPGSTNGLAVELHRRTGGHPLFVRELARLGSDDELPTAITVTLARRVAALPEPTRRCLDVAGVLGNRLLPDVLGAVVDASPAEVVDRLGCAVEAGVVRVGDGDELWFAHDLFRETVHHGLGVGERARLHGLVAQALEARRSRGGPVSAGDLARHLARAAGFVDAAVVVRWAQEAAAVEHRRGAFSEAAAHLRRARLAVADAGGGIQTQELVAVLVSEADATARSGDPDGARALLLQASDVAADAAEQVDVALAVQRLGAKFATPRDQVVARLESAREAIAGNDLAREARVTAALARELQHSVAEDRGRSGELSERALELGRRSGDDDTLVACLLGRHDALWRPGTGQQRSELGNRIAVVAARLGDTDRLADGLLLEANGLLESGSAGFRPVLDRWFGLLETRDEPRDRYLVRTRRAALALIDGQAESAEALMHDAATLGERIHEPDTGNVLMSQRVALARLRDDPAELTRLAVDAVRWWTGAPVLAHAVAAGARAAAGDLDAAAREVATVAAAGGWRSEDSYLRSVLVVELARAASALHDAELCPPLLAELRPIADSCGVNGAVVAFAGPFAHPAGALAAELGQLDLARVLLRASVDTARGLGATVWVRDGEAVLRRLADARSGPSSGVAASLSRTGGVWTVRFGAEDAVLPHAKGLQDLATLVARRGQEVTALQLMGVDAAGSDGVRGGGAEDVIDLRALRAYRARLDELTVEIDECSRSHDGAELARLSDEREHLLTEVRRSTGLGGRIRTVANVPAERARKAVSGRVRDSIRHLEAVAPALAAHLDRSVRTGLRLAYEPDEDEPPVLWHVDG